LNKISITVDFDISGNSGNTAIPFLLQKGAINNSTVRFYNVLNGEPYLLLQEVSRDGYVEGQTDTNPFDFSFDLKSLFQDIASLPKPTLIPAPTQIGGGSGKLIFDYFSYEYKKDFLDMKGEANVFIANADGTNLTPVTNMDGYNYLKSVSPDGTKALVISVKDWYAKVADLYLVDLKASNSEPLKLAKGVPYYYNFYNSVRWLDNTRIIYIGQGSQNYGIYLINADGTNPITIEKGNVPIEILGVTNDRVFWNTKTHRGGYPTYPVWWTNLDGSETGKLTYSGRQIGLSIATFLGNNIAFSPDGTKVAWADAGVPESGHKENLLQIANLTDIDRPFISVELIFSGPDLKWRRDGKSLIIFDEASVNWAAGKGSPTYGYFEVSAETGEVIKNFNLPDEVMGAGDNFTPLQCGDISPDDKLLPCLVFASDKTGARIIPAQLNFLNLETGVMSEVTGLSFSFIAPAPRNISWIP
jgi:hypothetical protein